MKRGALTKIIKKLTDDVISEVEAGADYAVTATRKRFQDVTRTWETDVNWATTQSTIDRKEIVLRIIAIGSPKALDVWRFVDEGTKAHVIRPKKAGGRLAFQSGYAPKTLPVAQFGGSGRRSGDKVYRQEVMHPGTEARLFSQSYALHLRKLARIEILRRLRRM